MKVVTKLRATVGLTIAQLRHERMRSVLAVIGVALAVLAATLLGSVGYGVVQTGQQKFDAADRDLWISGGPVRIAPGTLGGFSAAIHDAHAISTQISQRKSVQTAVPLLFQTTYVGTNPNHLETIVAVGVPGAGGNSVQITKGHGFSKGGSLHYSGGDYSGPYTREVIISPQIANQFNVSVGEKLYLGGTIVGAREHPYTVVGISPTFSRFLGVPTVTVPLSELQSMTGAALTDTASLITVSLRPSANPQVVEQRLTAAYPHLVVRTNQEQMAAVLAKQVVIIASGLTLVILAIIAGLALTTNLLALLVYQQRESIAALRATGVSTSLLMGSMAGQGLVIGVLGGGLGLALTPPIASLLNIVAERLVGFAGLVQTPPIVFAGGAVIAVLTGILSGAVAGWRVASVAPLEHLSR